MKSIKQFNISLLIRGFIIPIILLSTMTGGYRLNNKIVDLIDFGFTSKLSTMSATVGAFIDITDHEILITPRSMTKIRHLKHDSLFVLSDAGVIHHLFTDGSASLTHAFPFLDEVEHVISFDLSDDTIFVLSIPSNQQVRIDNNVESTLSDIRLSVQRWANDGVLESSAIIQSLPNASIAYDRETGRIAVGPNARGYLQIFSKDIVHERDINAPFEQILDIHFTDTGDLSVLTSNQQQITIDSVDGRVIGSTRISCQDTNDCPTTLSITQRSDDQFWGISSSLLLIQADGTIDPDFYAHDNYHDHTSERYLDYVIPMREIREKQHLTYLYSFILNEQDKSISYVLDSSVDDDFTHIGYIDDELELDDFIAATDVLLTLKPYVSAIKPWGQWGLVKIGFAPILAHDGSGKALMGADQNVSSISQISREALVILSLSSFVFLLFGASVSWVIANKLTAPLLVMKENVLGIAAGFLDRKIQEPALDDLKPLAALFREAGNNLKTEVLQGPKILQSFEEARCEQDFNSFLNLKVRQGSTEYIRTNIGTESSARIACNLKSGSGFIWIVSDRIPEVDLLMVHNQIYQFSELHFGSDENNSETLKRLFSLNRNELDCLVWVDTVTGKVSFMNSNVVFSGEKTKHRFDPDPNGIHTIDGHQLELDSDHIRIHIELKSTGST